MLWVPKMSEMKNETKVDLDRESIECNAGLAECKLKLPEHNRRLAEYNDDQETNYVNLLKKEWSKVGIMPTGGIMISCGTSILCYFVGDIMTITDIMAVREIGFLGHYVGSDMSK